MARTRDSLRQTRPDLPRRRRAPRHHHLATPIRRHALALFEEAIESGEGHPGFLLIDSPQKNLRRGSLTQPGTEIASRDDKRAEDTPDGGDDDAIAASSSTIVDRIYVHLSTWLAEHPEAQIIMVDNEPPARAADDVVVEYSADPSNPPYGLIDDEDGRKRPRCLSRGAGMRGRKGSV